MTPSTPPCRGVFGAVFGHKFVAREHITPPNSLSIDRFEGPLHVHEEIMRSLSRRVYVHDICERCGLIVDRRPE